MNKIQRRNCTFKHVHFLQYLFFIKYLNVTIIKEKRTMFTCTLPAHSQTVAKSMVFLSILCYKHLSFVRLLVPALLFCFTWVYTLYVGTRTTPADESRTWGMEVTHATDCKAGTSKHGGELATKKIIKIKFHAIDKHFFKSWMADWITKRTRNFEKN